MVTLGIGKHSETVFVALQSLGAGWHSRAEIAEKLGRKRLYEQEVSALEMLVILGSVEAVQVETGKGIPLRWEYRIKSKDV